MSASLHAVYHTTDNDQWVVSITTKELESIALIPCVSEQHAAITAQLLNLNFIP